MFDLSALLILSILNLIALVQVASNAMTPLKLQSALAGGTAIFCLSVSLMALGLVVLLPSPGMGIAMMSIASLVNLLAALGPLMRYLSEPRSAHVMHSLNGLVRASLVDTSPMPAAAPGRRSDGRSRTDARRSVRPLPQAIAIRAASAPLPGVPGAAGARTTRQPASMRPLTPRQTYTVPRRPNWLPTSSLAFLLRVDPIKMPDIFAEARASKARLPALARRVRLIAIPKRHPAASPHSVYILPSSFAAPDPAWQTTYGRMAALIRSA